MKKMMLFLLTISLLLSSGGMSAFAATESLNQNGNSQMEISYNASANGGEDSADWTVTVPASLTVGESETVSASGSWAPYDILSVTADEQVDMYLDGDVDADYATVPVTYNPIALSGSYTGAVSQDETVTVDKDKEINTLKFGVWEGVLTFYIEVIHDNNYSYGAIKGANLCVHQWSDSSDLGDGRHFRTCQICNISEYATHVYEPTSETVHTCICGATLTFDSVSGNYAVSEGSGYAKTYTTLDDAVSYAKQKDGIVVILEDMTEVYDFTQSTRTKSNDTVVIDPNGKKVLLHYNSVDDIKLMADYSATDIFSKDSVVTVSAADRVVGDVNEKLTVDFGDESDNNTLLVAATAYNDSSKYKNIYSKQGLEMLAESVNSGSSHAGWYVALCDDIDLNNENWTPIGNSKTFSGSFDGQGHTISNLKMESTGGSLGLFGKVSPSGATYIKNITLENVNVFGKKTNVAGLIGEASSGNSTATGNHLIINNIQVTGKVAIDGYCGVAAVMCAGNAAEISDIVIDVQEGSYVSSTKHGTSSTWNLVASVKSFGNVSTVKNITSNLDVYGKNIGVGGLFAILQGTSTVSNLSYSGTVTLTESSDSMTGGKYYYQYCGLLIGAPRFTIIADENTCTSTGKLVLHVGDEIKNSNDMEEFYSWGANLFGAARDNNYTNKSFSKTYVAQ